MKRQNLIAVNAAAQYIRTIINVILGFYSTRLILEALGENRYGIYTLVAGVVFLLSFVMNAMSTTTQRFLSYHQGDATIDKLKIVFGNSVLLHLILSCALLGFLEFLGLFLFDGFLNIQSQFMGAAKFTYQCVILTVIFTCMTSPFRGLLISHENLVYISIIDVIDGILKVIIAFVILKWNFCDEILTEYALLLTGVSVFNLLACSIYSFVKYPECIIPKFHHWNRALAKKMTSFAGWVVYSTFMIVGRNQGTAIVLNKFFGTVVNAAFGLAIQINSACMFISGSILNAFNPYIIKSEGDRKRETAIRYAMTASKLCYLMMLMVVVPLCFYMEQVLQLWLGNIPPYSVLFARIIIITTLCDQVTTGLSVINKAIGKLKLYSLTVDTVKILVVPLLIILLICGVAVKTAMLCYIFIELVSALLRLPILKKQAHIDPLIWVRNVILKIIPSTLIIILFYYSCSIFINISIIKIFIIIIIGSLILGLVSFSFALNSSERDVVKGIFCSIYSKISRNK